MIPFSSQVGVVLGSFMFAMAAVGCSQVQEEPGTKLIWRSDVAASPARAGSIRPYIGKPRPPVQVFLAPGPALESGVPGQLALQVRSGAAIGAVELVVEGDDGLAVVNVREMIPGMENARIAPADGVASFEIAATPTSGGTRYLSGFLSFEVNGVRQGLPFRIPVQVAGVVTAAPVVAKPDRLPVRDAAGELIDSMQAETTVR